METKIIHTKSTFAAPTPIIPPHHNNNQLPEDPKIGAATSV